MWMLSQIPEDIKTPLNDTREPENRELHVYREDMRGELLSLKKRGISIRISTV